MVFTISNYIDLFFRVSVVKIKNENGRDIDLSKTWESTGNSLMYSFHEFLGGRSVKVLKKSYCDEKTQHTFVGSVFRVPAAYIGIPFSIIGVCIKLLSWLFEKNAFARNRHLHQMQEKSLQEYQQWKRINALCNSLNEKKAEAKTNPESWSLQDLPQEVNLLVISFLEAKKDLYNLSLTSARQYILTHDNSIVKTTILPDEKRIKDIFSSIIELFPKHINLFSYPRMNLPAHKISDLSMDYRIQKYGSTKICEGVNFLKAEDLGSTPIKWGISPVPFVAIQVKYSKEDDRFLLSFFTHLASKLNLCSNQITRNGVITLTKQNLQNRRNISGYVEEALTPYQWVVCYPWNERSLSITSGTRRAIFRRYHLIDLFKHSRQSSPFVKVSIHPNLPHL